MGKPQQTYSKKAKEEKREERKENRRGGGLENMMAYVDEDGNITDTLPDPKKREKIKAESIEINVPKREKASAVRQGKVAFFNDLKGFGFIKDLETQEQYFVHVNGLLDEIEENDFVTFELERGMKGMNAIRVKKV